MHHACSTYFNFSYNLTTFKGYSAHSGYSNLTILLEDIVQRNPVCNYYYKNGIYFLSRNLVLEVSFQPVITFIVITVHVQTLWQDNYELCVGLLSYCNLIQYVEKCIYFSMEMLNEFSVSCFQELFQHNVFYLYTNIIAV